MHFVLPLNDTQVVLLPGETTGLPDPRAVQITVKSNIPQNVEILIAYTLAQRDITEIILRLVTAHLQKELPKRFVLNDDRFTLTGVRREWTYGKKLGLWWGEAKVCPCKDKWSFVFAVK